MAKCEICKAQIQELFLGKLKGSIVKDPKGKPHTLCFECQKKFPTKTEQLTKLT